MQKEFVKKKTLEQYPLKKKGKQISETRLIEKAKRLSLEVIIITIEKKIKENIFIIFSDLKKNIFRNNSQIFFFLQKYFYREKLKYLSYLRINYREVILSNIKKIQNNFFNIKQKFLKHEIKKKLFKGNREKNQNDKKNVLLTEKIKNIHFIFDNKKMNILFKIFYDLKIFISEKQKDIISKEKIFNRIQNNKKSIFYNKLKKKFLISVEKKNKKIKSIEILDKFVMKKNNILKKCFFLQNKLISKNTKKGIKMISLLFNYKKRLILKSIIFHFKSILFSKKHSCLTLNQIFEKIIIKKKTNFLFLLKTKSFIEIYRKISQFTFLINSIINKKYTLNKAFVFSNIFSVKKRIISIKPKKILQVRSRSLKNHNNSSKTVSVKNLNFNNNHNFSTSSLKNKLSRDNINIPNMADLGLFFSPPSLPVLYYEKETKKEDSGCLKRVSFKSQKSVKKEKLNRKLSGNDELSSREQNIYQNIKPEEIKIVSLLNKNTNLLQQKIYSEKNILKDDDNYFYRKEENPQILNKRKSIIKFDKNKYYETDGLKKTENKNEKDLCVDNNLNLSKQKKNQKQSDKKNINFESDLFSENKNEEIAKETHKIKIDKEKYYRNLKDNFLNINNKNQKVIIKNKDYSNVNDSLDINFKKEPIINLNRKKFSLYNKKNYSSLHISKESDQFNNKDNLYKKSQFNKRASLQNKFKKRKIEKYYDILDNNFPESKITRKINVYSLNTQKNKDTNFQNEDIYKKHNKNKFVQSFNQ